MTENERVQTELARIEQAIAAVRDALSGPALEVTLTPLLEQRATLLAQLTGGGAIAQGADATALGAGAVQAGQVGGHIIGRPQYHLP